MKENYDAHLDVLVTYTMSMAVKGIAAEEEISMNKYVRTLIAEDMKRREIEARTEIAVDRRVSNHGSSVSDIGQKSHG